MNAEQSSGSPLIYADAGNAVRVAFDQAALKVALTLCERSHSLETGGILIGRYLDAAQALVSEATGPPPGSTAGRAWFERGARGLKGLLARRWKEEPRTYYLGEWHYHTGRVPWPSSQDMAQMRAVARDKRYRCHQPILLVVSPVAEGQWHLLVLVIQEDGAVVQLALASEAPDTEELQTPEEYDDAGDVPLPV